MKLIKTLKNKLKNPINVYYVRVEFMHGDADHETHQTIECLTEKNATDLINFVNEYSEYELQQNNEKFYELAENFAISIPGDITTDHQFRAMLDGIESISYFDQNGTEYDVKWED